MKKTSFNVWLKSQDQDPLGTFYSLACAWVVGRGRLTRESVGARVEAMGFHADRGYAAWDAYQAFLLAPPATSAGVTETNTVNEGTPS